MPGLPGPALRPRGGPRRVERPRGRPGRRGGRRRDARGARPALRPRGLEDAVRASQARRQVVAAALRTGRHRAWDLVPDPEPRYVRGDFRDALDYGTVAAD
ncbi:hypothetical protein [Serinicoccus sp. CUA-874]|uniref:hypothetical protein n=1 Tax=Serinicoccus sp. CUA-874 TaxID=1517939 RepID=UPI002AA2A510|nr:hypothetical protein [Serinicoccus sp. CUA-874]